ncbi:MAG: hydroxypyruvate isomerase [Burkholderiales bacterium]
MPRFCVNLSFLFGDRPFQERFDAAARAGFRAVELHFPYEFDKAVLAECAGRAGVAVVLFNLPPGDWAKGERGIACHPDRVDEFRDGVGLALEYALALDCGTLNCLLGVPPPDADESAVHESVVANLRFAADALAAHGRTLVIEPLNTRTVPGFYVTSSKGAAQLVREVGAPNLKIQYDLFHMQIMEGDLAKTLEALLPMIGHVQFADVPDRHEPGTGEINFDFLFGWLDRLGYAGWVGAEYQPSRTTEQTLAWTRRWLAPLPRQQQTTPAAREASGQRLASEQQQQEETGR